MKINTLQEFSFVCKSYNDYTKTQIKENIRQYINKTEQKNAPEILHQLGFQSIPAQDGYNEIVNNFFKYLDEKEPAIDNKTYYQILNNVGFTPTFVKEKMREKQFKDKMQHDSLYQMEERDI